MTAPEVPDIEVARYALRTFTLTTQAAMTTATTWTIGVSGDMTSDAPEEEPEALRSVSMYGNYWADGTCEAICLNNTAHEAPRDGCQCGIYGTLDLPTLLRQYKHYADQLVTVIAAEGRTIIGDKGLRTQYARVVAYWTPQSRIREVCERQFAHAGHFGELSDMLKAYNLPPELELPQTRVVVSYSDPEDFVTTGAASIWTQTLHRLRPAPPRGALWWRQTLPPEGVRMVLDEEKCEVIYSWHDPCSYSEMTVRPYAVHVGYYTKSRDVTTWGGSIIATLQDSYRTYIDVLLEVAPTAGRWDPITTPGYHTHPGALAHRLA